MFTLKRALMTAAISGIFFTGLTTNALAYNNSNNNVAEFSLVIQNNDISLKYPSSVNRARVSTARATWWQPLSKWLQGALSLAYVDMSQNTYNNVAAYNTTGYDIGVGLRGSLLQSKFVNMGLSFTADYLSTSGGTSLGNKTDISWFEYVGSADFSFIPTKPVSILAGVSYTIIDGRQKIYSNTLNLSRDFSANTPEGYYAGLSIKTGQTGRINMRWYEGTRQGFYLTFSNRF